MLLFNTSRQGNKTHTIAISRAKMYSWSLVNVKTGSRKLHNSIIGYSQCSEYHLYLLNLSHIVQLKFQCNVLLVTLEISCADEHWVRPVILDQPGVSWSGYYDSLHLKLIVRKTTNASSNLAWNGSLTYCM